MIKPRYIAIAAITLDGKIARNKSHMSDWTSKEDKIFMRALLDKCDAIIVGNNTYKTAIGPLSKRNCIVISRSADSGQRTVNLVYCKPNKTELSKLLKPKSYKLIAILGGAQTYSFCLKNNLLDELYLTVEPVVFGQGISLFADDNHLNKKFKLISEKKLNKRGSLLLHYIKI
ncbi:MAG: dihydrofolate reductase family protein [Candidatus Doudnabacteria bacterium]|nr:dihydrofolate reductase family protein [Candidatus Doudnabacteria bacterium]